MTARRLAVPLAAVLLVALRPAAAEPVKETDQPGGAAPAAYWVYVGTYTADNGSKGVYRSKLDAKTGKLSEPELVAELKNPTFLAVSPDKKNLYAVGETGGTGGGGVFAFALDAKSGGLKKLNEDTSGGDGPCHVSVDAGGDRVAVANYGGGSTALFRLDAEGKLGGKEFVQHKGSGANKDRQSGPHAHNATFTPDGKYLLVADLGLDKVKVFDGRTLKELADRDIALPPGSGPRHLAVTKDGKYAYVCGELDSTVNVVKLDLDGKSEVVQTLSTLTEPVRGNSTAECILSPDGKFVYVSNRGHNSIAAYKVGEDHKLTAAGHITGDIKIPRNFAVDPSGKWMLIASQDGDKVGVWAVDPATGMAKETGTTIKVARPVCVRFVPAG